MSEDLGLLFCTFAIKGQKELDDAFASVRANAKATDDVMGKSVKHSADEMAKLADVTSRADREVRKLGNASVKPAIDAKGLSVKPAIDAKGLSVKPAIDTGGITAGLGELQKKLEPIKQAMDGFARGATVAFAGLTGTLGGFVRAGLAGTGTGQVLANSMTQLSREIASVFLPTIEKVIKGVQAVTSWFRSLSGEQQGVIRRFAEGAVVGLGLAVVMPKIVAGMAAVGAAAKAMGAAIAAGRLAAGDFTALIGPIVALGTGIALGTESGRKGLAALYDAFKPVIDAISEIGSEIATELSPVITDLTDTFKESAQAVAEIVIALKPLLKMFADMQIKLWVAELKLLASGLQVVAFAVQTSMATFNVLIEAFTKIVDWLKDIVEWAGKASLGISLVIGGKDKDKEKDKAQEEEKKRRDLQAQGGGFEDVANSYKRLQASASRVDMPKDDAAQQERKKTSSALERIETFIKGAIKSPVGRTAAFIPSLIVD